MYKNRKFLGDQFRKESDPNFPKTITIDGVVYSKKIFVTEQFVKINDFYHIIKLRTTIKDGIHIPSKIGVRFLIVSKDVIYNEGIITSTKIPIDNEYYGRLLEASIDDLCVLASYNKLLSYKTPASMNRYSLETLKTIYVECLTDKLSGIS